MARAYSRTVSVPVVSPPPAASAAPLSFSVSARANLVDVSDGELGACSSHAARKLASSALPTGLVVRSGQSASTRSRSPSPFAQK